jgi:SET domain-containing protein
MNHCCEPNAYAKVISAASRSNDNAGESTAEQPQEKHIVIFAARTIHPNEEITYDYKFPVEENNKLKCYCGASKCQGTMN